MDKSLENYQKRMVELEAANQALQAQLADAQKEHQQTKDELQTVRYELQKFQTQPSGQTLHWILNTMPEAAFWKDCNSVYLGCNQQFSKVAGLGSPEQIVGKTDFDLSLTHEEATWFRDCDRRVIESNRPELGIIESIQQADGHRSWLETNKMPLHDAQGTVVGILGTFMEITARVEAELQLKQLNEELGQQVDIRTQELQSSEARLQRLAANLPGLILQFRLEADGTHSFPYVSEGCRDIFELEPDNFLQCFHLIHPSDFDGLEQALRDSALTLCGLHYEHRIITPSGKLKWVQTIARPEKTADDAILWDGLMIEISDRKQAEKEQQRLLSIIEATPDIVGIADAQGNHLYLNPAGKTSLDFTDKTFKHSNIRECHPPNVLKKLETEAIPAAIQTGMWRGESWLRSLNGQEFPVSQVILAHHDEDGSLEFISTVMRNISDLKQLEAEREYQEQTLRSIVKKTATQTGEAFFKACVKQIALALNTQYVLIAKVIDDGKQQFGQTVAFWNGSDFGENFKYNLAETPCFNIFQSHTICRYPHSLQQEFPENKHLINWHAESYVGIPIFNPDGQMLGYISVIDTEPMAKNAELEIFILEIFAGRTGAEMERIQVEKALIESTKKVQQQAQREQLLNQIANQIRISLDLNSILDTAVREIQQFLGVDRCHFAWYIEANNQGEAYWDITSEVQVSGLPSFIGKHIASGFGMFTDKILQQEILQIDDISLLEDAEARATLTALGNKSMLVLPVHAESEKFGIISCIHSQTIRPWQHHEIKLLKSVVAQLEIALNQADLLAQSLARSEKLETLINQLKSAQSRLVQSEKMSSLGQMVAGVAHEINNPVNFIYGNLVHAKNYTQDLVRLIELYQHSYPNATPDIQTAIDETELEFLKLDLPKLFQSMEVGTERIQEIIKSLRLFSRLDESEIKQIDVHDGIDSTLTILQTRLRAQHWRPKIQVVKEYGNLPQIECYAGQLNQVFMNLLSNAIDTLEERDQERTWQQIEQNPSIIQIRTQVLDHLAHPAIAIAVTDNGTGIKQNAIEYLFNPFFTTKPVGKGTGLGLSISYQIITETHGGTITYITELGKGTTFTITLPIKQ
ncbi:MAG: GAF domain-containing protein [Cyanobacteria bacterium P01_H01_bin.105]